MLYIGTRMFIFQIPRKLPCSWHP